MSHCRPCYDENLPQQAREHWHAEEWAQVEEALHVDGLEVRDGDMDLVVDLADVPDSSDDRYLWYVSKGDEHQATNTQVWHRYRVERSSVAKIRVFEEDRVSEAEVAQAIESITRVLTPAEERSHLIDDHEKARTSTLRTLLVQSDLLDDAKHALTHGRYQVAEEFMDRAMVSIREEIERLRAQGKA